MYKRQLYGTDAVLSVDPYVDNGIEEAEITTVLLSEASTAREGVALLTLSLIHI